MVTGNVEFPQEMGSILYETGRAWRITLLHTAHWQLLSADPVWESADLGDWIVAAWDMIDQPVTVYGQIMATKFGRKMPIM